MYALYVLIVKISYLQFIHTSNICTSRLSGKDVESRATSVRRLGLRMTMVEGGNTTGEVARSGCLG